MPWTKELFACLISILFLWSPTDWSLASFLYLLNEVGSQLSISVEMLLPNQSLAPRCPCPVISSAVGSLSKGKKNPKAPHDERREVYSNQHQRTNQKVPSQPSLKNLTVARGFVYIVDRIYTQLKSIISLPSLRRNSLVMYGHSVTFTHLLKIRVDIGQYILACWRYYYYKLLTSFEPGDVFESLGCSDLCTWMYVNQRGCWGSNPIINRDVFVRKEKQSTQATMKTKDYFVTVAYRQKNN